MKKLLTFRSKLFALCNLEPIQAFVRQVDLSFYQNLIQVLVPDVLKPIPATLTQSIRNFAKSKYDYFILYKFVHN